jgi:hypothetical protein
MTVPCFQYWRLRVTENYGGDTVKIDSISFLERSGGDPISIDGEAIANAGDASGAFSGGAGWALSISGKPETFSIAFNKNLSGDGAFVINKNDNEIIERISLDSNDTASCSVKFSPDGQYLAIYTNTELFVLETTEYTIVFNKQQTNNLSKFCLSWSPDSRYLACTKSVSGAIDTLSVFDSYNSWADVFPSSLSANRANDLAWSHDGSYLCVANSIEGGSGKPLIFNTSDWSIISVSVGSPENGGFFYGCQFSNDGTKLYLSVFILGGFSRFLTINTTTWTRSGTAFLSGSFVSGFQISPDENYVAVAFRNSIVNPGTGVRLYSISNGALSEVSLSSSVTIPNAVSANLISWSYDSSDFLFAGDTGKLFSINASTGIVFEVSSINAEVQNVNSCHYAPYFPPAPSGGGAIGYKFALPVTPTHIDMTASGTSRPKTGVIEYSADGRTWYALQTLGFD